MAVFILQTLGCDVSALNTVHFSMIIRSVSTPFSSDFIEWLAKSMIADLEIGNHTGYGQFKGTKASAHDIHEIYDGLKQNYLTDFDILLSGYVPSAETINAIGTVARDLKLNASTKPGSFFWGDLSPPMCR